MQYYLAGSTILSIFHRLISLGLDRSNSAYNCTANTGLGWDEFMYLFKIFISCTSGFKMPGAVHNPITKTHINENMRRPRLKR